MSKNTVSMIYVIRCTAFPLDQFVVGVSLTKAGAEANWKHFCETPSRYKLYFAKPPHIEDKAISKHKVR